jgi:catechol 2,3-dioxygenase-like lactoylglutathione lyase family enzyme
MKVQIAKSSREEDVMQVQFVASVSPIVRDSDAARSFYQGALGLSFEGGEGEYIFTEKLPGVRHFGLWPLSEAARSCFGADDWPDDVPVPQASVEFEVPDVAAAAEELRQRGYRLIHGVRTEPWTQITARLLSPEGLLVAVSYAPWLHEGETSADGSA